jgi:hypothetical protein
MLASICRKFKRSTQKEKKRKEKEKRKNLIGGDGQSNKHN